MTQLIITWGIVSIALGWAIYLFVQRWRKPKKKVDGCTGCSSDCGDCIFAQGSHHQKKQK